MQMMTWIYTRQDCDTLLQSSTEKRVRLGTILKLIYHYAVAGG